MKDDIRVINAHGEGRESMPVSRLRAAEALPTKNEIAPTAESAEAILIRDYKDCRILLVDDNTFNRDVTLGILDELGQTIDIARDGVEAVELAGKNGYDLILMDIQMPRMDGLEATRKIRMQPDGAKVPILALTANTLAEDKEHCFEAGMNGYITKPVEFGVLFSSMLEWLSKSGKTLSRG